MLAHAGSLHFVSIQQNLPFMYRWNMQNFDAASTIYSAVVIYNYNRINCRCYIEILHAASMHEW